jgi:hypothetical protein
LKEVVREKEFKIGLERRALKGLYTIRPSPELGEEDKEEETVETGEGRGNRLVGCEA